MRIEEAIKIVVKCARLYDRELNGKSLLAFYLIEKNKVGFIELFFWEEQFMHLTGLKSSDDKKPLYAGRFYEKCINQKLQAGEVKFSDYGSTPLKLEILPYILCSNLQAKMIGDFNGSTIKLMSEKLIGNQRAFIGFVAEKNYYVPNTIIKGDVRDYTKNRSRIIAVFRKNQKETEYDEITYMARGIDWESITFPEKFLPLLKKLQEQNKNCRT